MVSKMPPMRPSQFSALKVLNPLHDQEEHGEDDDRQADVQHVEHGNPPGHTGNDVPVEPPLTWKDVVPYAIHAARGAVLTRPMRARRKRGRTPRACGPAADGRAVRGVAGRR